MIIAQNKIPYFHQYQTDRQYYHYCGVTTADGDAAGE